MFGFIRLRRTVQPAQLQPALQWKPRRTLQLRRLPGPGAAPHPSGVRVRARAAPDGRWCEFILSKCLAPRHSWRCSSEDSPSSPLAQAIREHVAFDALVVHESTLTVECRTRPPQSWSTVAPSVAAALRFHVASGLVLVPESELAALPPEQEIAASLRLVLDSEIRPQVAQHGGEITLERVERNTAYIRLAGACHGCGSAPDTLRNGVEAAFRRAVPALGAIVDVSREGVQ